MPESALDTRKFPLVDLYSPARAWVQMQANAGRDPKTVEAYGRGVHYFFRFLRSTSAVDTLIPTSSSRESSRQVSAEGGWYVQPNAVTEEHVARYIRWMREDAGRDGRGVASIETGGGLRLATMRQRITAVRLLYDYLVRKGIATSQPFMRGGHNVGSGAYRRGLVRTEVRLPWIPDDAEWRAFLIAAADAPMRDRMMIALAYDCALRREEVVLLEVGDLTVPTRLLKVRAEIAKRSRERVTPFSPATGRLLSAYLPELHGEIVARAQNGLRGTQGKRTRLFTSLSDRNRGRPISIWTWNKVIRRIADPLGLTRFTTHTFRHLSLTNLARAGWDLGDIASFAGHRSTESTLRYIHLSGRDLAAKIARSTARLHAHTEMMGAILLRESQGQVEI